MPLLYNEGKSAFLRLQEELLKSSIDQSIFAWGMTVSKYAQEKGGIFARSPADYVESSSVVPFQGTTDTTPYVMTNKGIQIELRMIDSLGYSLGLIDCQFQDEISTCLGIVLLRTHTSGVFFRIGGTTVGEDSIKSESVGRGGLVKVSYAQAMRAAIRKIYISWDDRRKEAFAVYFGEDPSIKNELHLDGITMSEVPNALWLSPLVKKPEPRDLPRPTYTVEGWWHSLSYGIGQNCVAYPRNRLISFWQHADNSTAWDIFARFKAGDHFGQKVRLLNVNMQYERAPSEHRDPVLIRECAENGLAIRQITEMRLITKHSALVPETLLLLFQQRLSRLPEFSDFGAEPYVGCPTITLLSDSKTMDTKQLPADNSQDKTRKRRAHHKSRTGCGTCLIRRVKCDETRPVCQRCVKFEVLCDGYKEFQRKGERKIDRRLTEGTAIPIRTSNRSPEANLRIYSAATAICKAPPRSLFRNEQEYRYFEVFTTQIANQLTGLFPSSLWNYLVLQACESNSSIRHAVIAIGALDPKTWGGRAKSPEEKLRRQFAYNQYKAFQELETQSLTYDCSSTHLSQEQILTCRQITRKTLQPQFISMRQARTALYLLEVRQYHWSGTSGYEWPWYLASSPMGSTTDPPPNVYTSNEEWCTERETRFEEYAVWSNAFQPLLLQARRAKDPYELRRAAILRAMFLSAYLSLMVPMLSPLEAYYGQTTKLRELMDLIKSLLTTAANKDSRFSMEMNFVIPLSRICYRFRHRAMRQEAIRLLLSYPRREGLFDGVLIGRYSQWLAEIEEEGLGDEEEYVPHELVNTTLVVVNIDTINKTAKLTASKKVRNDPSKPNKVEKVIMEHLYFSAINSSKNPNWGGCRSKSEMVQKNLVVVDITHNNTIRFDENGINITSIDSIVTTGDLFFSHFSPSRLLYQVFLEDWSTLAADARDTRAAIQAAADAYYDYFTNNSLAVPWGTPCTRIEGGSLTANGDCRTGPPDGAACTADKRYVIDETASAVDVISNFGDLGADTHELLIEGGKIVRIHSMTLCGGCSTFNCGLPMPDVLTQPISS
ncbi:hypothetical protein G7Y89_g2903 [Cudoniella acicularis]|uniref:Zn(2)-C6 fungal-type domain-containing protein n=1 Tax=Cudoniella acicularis TaxID=354080 RepID=A0A8H4RSE8_9HELO|nr:hypothetical protein G7Y89_g2903 [Cudoniella acicularis]